MARVPAPRRRHRHQHEVQERDDLGADDLCAAGLPDARTAGAVVGPVALAGFADHATRSGLRPAAGTGPPPVHQDAHAARRAPARPAAVLTRLTWTCRRACTVPL